MLKFMHSS